MGPIGIALLLQGVIGQGLRNRILAGVAFGFGWMGPGLFWATDFHIVGFFALVLLETTLVTVGVVGIHDRRRMAAIPAIFVFIEVLRIAVPFGGLPLAGIALGQTEGPLLPIAGLFGHLGITAATAAIGAALISLWKGQRLAAVMGFVVVAALALSDLSSIGVKDSGTSLTVAAVQGGGPRGTRAIDDDADKVFQRHLVASRKIPDNGADIVLWPENVLSIDTPIEKSSEQFALARLARRVDGEVIVGVVEREGDRFRNAAVGWDAFGRLSHRYEKHHRVPFGEYVPLRGLLEHVVDLSVLPRDAIVGDKKNVLNLQRGKAGILISFEVFFDSRGRQAAIGKADILLVPTNASSYTTDAVPAQEVAAAQLRAVESSRWLVQAAPTGYSAFVAPDGKVVQQTKLGEQQVLTQKVQLRKGNTPYTVIGNVAFVLIAALSFLWATLMGRNQPSE